MPPANGKGPKVKPSPPSMRRTFYSPIAMDELTREDWTEETYNRSGPFWSSWFPFGPNLDRGTFYYLTFIHPLVLLAKRVNAKYLRDESAKWIPNTDKLGGLAFKGRLDMSAAAASKALHVAFTDSLGVKYKTVIRLVDMRIVVAMFRANPESMGMTKLYVFLKPLDGNSCTVYCRAYKRLLVPFEDQHNTKVDRPSREAIAKVMSGLDVQDVQLEWFSPAGRPETQAPFPLRFSLSMLSVDDSPVRSRLEGMVAEIKKQVDAVIFAYVSLSFLAFLVFVIFLLVTHPPNG